jgi:hypothetical protein
LKLKSPPYRGPHKGRRQGKMGLLSSAKLVGDALHRASPDAERPGDLQDPHTLRKLPSHLPFGRAVTFGRPSLTPWARARLSPAFIDTLERRRPRTGRGQVVGVNNAHVSRELGARFNPPRAGLSQTSPWLTPRGRSRQRGRAPFHCCARAASGDSAAPPSAAINSRRPIVRGMGPSRPRAA